MGTDLRKEVERSYITSVHDPLRILSTKWTQGRGCEFVLVLVDVLEQSRLNCIIMIFNGHYMLHEFNRDFFLFPNNKIIFYNLQINNIKCNLYNCKIISQL